MSRLRRDVEFRWIDDAKLIVRNGMTGATGNIYCGLHEFADMAFVMHLLRPGDLFVDVGANIGSYTILASAVAGSETIAVEPDPGVAAALKRNIAANGLDQRARVVEAAMGSTTGRLPFTVGLDTVNHVAASPSSNTRDVPVLPLDEVLEAEGPTLIKLDVEGYEAEVLAGARATLAKPELLAVETESRAPEVFEQLRAAGFAPTAYDPFSRSLRAGEDPNCSNALFVRDIAACQARLASAPRRRVLGRLI